MTVAHAIPIGTRSGPRWLLLGSLALNLFFIGIAIAMAVRGPLPPSWDRNVFVRLERLAATLPPADASLLRGEINAERTAIEAAQTSYRSSQEVVRAAIGREPFDGEALRTAMMQSRAARMAYDQTIQSVVLVTAPKMSPEGRRAIAEWPPRRPGSTARQ